MFLHLADQVSDSIVNNEYIIYNTMVMRYTEENDKWYSQWPELFDSKDRERKHWRRG